MFLPSNITLKFGDSGDFVAELQRRLAMVKCFSEDQVNGFYDGTTVNGVMQFQGTNGLHADGVAGPETLRRLNGVIAGDTGGTTDNKQEEEAKQLAATQQEIGLAVAQQENNAAMWGGEPAPTREEVPAVSAPQAAFGPDPSEVPPPPEQASPISQVPPPSPAEMADRARAEQPVAQSTTQDLTAMLMAATQQPPQPQMPEPPSPRQQAAATAQPEFGTRPPIPEPEPQQPRVFKPDPEPEPEPMGLVQRAGRFANAMIQKLADYFESKLPQSVIHEVRAAGNIMAQHGVREAPIPTGPDTVRAPEQVPARGPEQQPQQIR